MMSQAAGYAATALGYVAAAGGRPTLVKDIADATDIPAPYLAKIIQTLARRGVVTTQRGIGGGVILARPASEISLYDLCIALDDPAVETRCMMGIAACSDDRACPCHGFWTKHRAASLDFLRSQTVADVAAFETRRRWKPSPPASEAS
ncbi:MAG: RrF2 family transcriptional regulator [Phycisphaerales bacterium]